MKQVLLTGLPTEPEWFAEHKEECLFHGGEVPTWTVHRMAEVGELVGFTLDVTYVDKDKQVTQRRVTINSHYRDNDEVDVHCHLRNQRRRLRCKGITTARFVEAEYDSDVWRLTMAYATNAYEAIIAPCYI